MFLGSLIVGGFPLSQHLVMAFFTSNHENPQEVLSLLLSPSGIFPRYRKVEGKSNVMSKVSAINCYHFTKKVQCIG